MNASESQYTTHNNTDHEVCLFPQHTEQTTQIQVDTHRRPDSNLYIKRGLIFRKLIKNKIGRGGIRTPDLLVRSQILYPTKLHVLTLILAKYWKDV